MTGLPDFINDGPDELRTMTALPCWNCGGYQPCECYLVDFETARRMILAQETAQWPTQK